MSSLRISEPLSLVLKYCPPTDHFSPNRQRNVRLPVASSFATSTPSLKSISRPGTWPSTLILNSLLGKKPPTLRMKSSSSKGCLASLSCAKTGLENRSDRNNKMATIRRLVILLFSRQKSGGGWG
jgi:hypothetical protein